MKKIICLLLCRSGSKGIPKKNIKLLAGKPLLAYVLEEAKKCEFFDRIVVSTDDDEIYDIVNTYRDYNNNRVDLIIRPPELATDTSKSIDAVKHALSIVDTDYVMLLNACTPFNKAIFISGMIKMCLEKRADSVVSLIESFDSHPSKLCQLDENNLVIPFGKFETRERQGLEKTYRRNTCMYMATKETILSGSFFGKKNYGFIMPQENSLDINTPYDFLIANLYMKHLND